MTVHAVPEVDEGRRPSSWRDWHRFARRQLDYGHDEAVVYANVRTVEEQNGRRMIGGQTSV